MRKWLSVAVALAGVAGGGGVILAAVAAHSVPDERLQIAAGFLLLHAAAAIAVCGLALALACRAAWFLCAAALFLSGGLLFGGDLSARALIGTRLFPMAAPLGGTALILGWVVVVLAALATLRSPHRGAERKKIDE